MKYHFCESESDSSDRVYKYTTHVTVLFMVLFCIHKLNGGKKSMVVLFLVVLNHIILI